tara:strand:- start:47 stop:568 length:522 start_codon:yes stop_codon:yes gene_type:complete
MFKRNIVIIGMMAAGKTTIGFKLAQKLKYHFIDIDQEIEKFEKEKIIDIFQTKGEEYFRKIEEKITLSLLEKNRSVISLGGGAFLNKKIRKKIKKSSYSFWLNWKFSTIFVRISKNQRRPLALKMNREDLANLYRKRVKFYKFSDFKVKCDNKSKNEIINQIIKIINDESPTN